MAHSNEKAERIYNMLRAGVDGGTIRRNEKISLTSLAAYKANLTREEEWGADESKLRLKEGEVRDIVTAVLDEALDSGEIDIDSPNYGIIFRREKRLKNVSRRRLAAYAASWARGAYDK